jgi:TctA family transporter
MKSFLSGLFKIFFIVVTLPLMLLVLMINIICSIGGYDNKYTFIDFIIDWFFGVLLKGTVYDEDEY